jgi:hypothetical protein
MAGRWAICWQGNAAAPGGAVAGLSNQHHPAPGRRMGEPVAQKMALSPFREKEEGHLGQGLRCRSEHFWKLLKVM